MTNLGANLFSAKESDRPLDCKESEAGLIVAAGVMEKDIQRQSSSICVGTELQGNMPCYCYCQLKKWIFYDTFIIAKMKSYK
jgi:hypothetical protein